MTPTIGCHLTKDSISLSTGIGLALIFSLLLVAGVAIGCGSSPGGAVDLIPDDARYVKIWYVEGVLGRDFPIEEADRFEDYLYRNFGYLDFFLDGLETLILVDGDQGELWILEGDYDLEEIRYELEDLRYEDDEYRGYEVWQEGDGTESLALLGEGRYVIIGVGDDDPVNNVLRSLRRDRGFLLDEKENKVGRTLAKVGKGWIVTVVDGCDISSDIRGCESMGIVVSEVDRSDRIKVAFTFLFRNERAAKAGAEDLEDIFERNDWTRNMNIEAPEVDGNFVTINATMDKDFLRDLNILIP